MLRLDLEASDHLKGSNIRARRTQPDADARLDSTAPAARVASPGRALRTTAPKGARRHVYQCPLCRRLFNREGPNPAIRLHKDESGWPCGGRQGNYLGER